MAATVRISYASGAGPALATAETGIKFNREETLAGTTAPIPRPVATGTAFSWGKVFCLEVTATDTTSISNRKLHMDATLATGLNLWYRDDGDTYTRVTGNADADSGSNGATPTGYSAMPTTATVFDSGSDAASATGRSGDYFTLALGISNSYAGGANSNLALANLVVTYDEA